jgi:two-component system, NarL family, sensor histidine kinase DesK
VTSTAPTTSTVRMRRTAMLTAMVAIVPAGCIAAFMSADTWWEGAVLVGGLLLSLPILRLWSIERYTRAAFGAAVFSLLVWVSIAMTAASPLGFFTAALVYALLIQRLPHGRLAATLGLVLAIALCGAAVFIPRPPTPELAERFILLPALGTLVIAGVVVVCERSWLLAERLDRAKATEAALAVERERSRFAGDLHDIQGHTLHVANLKLAVAERTAAADPERAVAEVREVRALIGETIGRTRSLAYAEQRLNLDAEIANARGLCEAAGIDARVVVGAAGPDAPHPLLAQVLREATTNLLRHARPRHVVITSGAGSVRIENDGVTGGQDGPERGLARLRERVESAGGALGAVRSGDRFTVEATIAPAEGTS